ncbi:MAG TPA: N-acetylglutaminylglutamine synthetase [Noviherbaspirillum sp.]|uniref:N-acetylglutaminylglutamine synthetase n=1 Tax=Noviherbaspirillum sp. TaxID=1926288 RepID=UPI002D6139BD|nr:N-acetylglutaminylglutamine synthetase [Noviherbaspirillum sp.]HYD95342.1 N-acetylglutaminylglutamine synthetase [Noviherbaspirillum sp.]
MSVSPHQPTIHPARGQNTQFFKQADDGALSPAAEEQSCRLNAAIECGWGRLLYGPSFESPQALAQALQEEQPGKRDIALYVESPQLVLAEAPSHLFLDPSLIFRRMLGTELEEAGVPHIAVRPLSTRADIAAINRLYSMRGMVPVDPKSVWRQRNSRAITYMIAEDERTGEIVGTAMGIDHVEAFGDEHGGCSLWCLAVDPQNGLSGAGRALVNCMVAHFAERGRRFLDLSVLHNNEAAIGLYRKLGFEEVPGFVVKNKNAINEKLFVDTTDFDGLNPYAMIIINEARRRGISVEVIDAAAGIFKLRNAGHEMLCRESLTELTGGVAMTWCQDKVLTSRRLASIGLRVPRQRTAGEREADVAFLREHGAVVVKPALGEQGKGVFVDVRTEEQLDEAIRRAAEQGGHVVIEEYCAGQDLRIVVIGYKVVAAAIRRPAEIIGDGTSTVLQLIERQSARRAAATGGESRIPLDGETERCLAGQGLGYDTVLENGRAVKVRKTANLHTGGTIHDVTAELHPALAEAAETAARALRIPVVGLDFLVPAPDAAEYVIVEANERPGLANHEPQPTAQRFIDLLFPFTAAHA